MEKYSHEKHKNEYISMHKKRFDFLVKKIKKYQNSPDIKILDIGRSPFTKILSNNFSNISTLGLPPEHTLLDKTDPIDVKKIPYLIFDLNDSCNRDSWIKLEEQDIVIFAEVLEHLAVHSQCVFEFINNCLKINGILICQTPNAVSLSKRLKMIFGLNPFQEFIIELEKGQHHFREYTKAELSKFGKECGFVLVEHSFENYFHYDTKKSTIFNFIASIIPSFRNGQTAIFKKVKEVN